MEPEPLRRIAAALAKGERFVLSSHVRPDGDSIGSQLALAHALRALGKTARIVNRDAPPAYLGALIGVQDIEVRGAAAGRFDAAVVLDCGTLARTEVAGLDRQPVLNIDHHAGNALYGAINWFDPTAAACAEMVHDLIAALGVPLTPEIGAALYAGILTDTGSFHHANITARTFEICRRIAACGVDPAAMAAAVYQNSSLGKIRLTGRLLHEMRLAAGGRVALLHVDEALLRDTGMSAGRHGRTHQRAAGGPRRRGGDHVARDRRRDTRQPPLEGTRGCPCGGRGFRRRGSSQRLGLFVRSARQSRRTSRSGANRRSRRAVGSRGAAAAVGGGGLRWTGS